MPHAQQSQNNYASLLQKLPWRKIVLRLFTRLTIRLLLPIVLYHILELFFPIPEMLRLCIAAIPALLFITLSLLRKQGIDLFGVLAISGFALSFLLTLLTEDVQLLSLRGAFVHMMLGFIFLTSLAFFQPMSFTLYKYVAIGGISHQDEWLINALEQEPSMRSTFRSMTLIISCGLIVVAIVYAILVLLPISPVLRYVVHFIVMILDTLLGIWAFHIITTRLHCLKATLP